MRRFSILAVLMLAAVLVSLPALAQQDVITTAIGGGPNGIPALDANLYNPYGVAVDSSGNFYIAAFNQNRVFKVNSGGTITVVAGSGAQGYSWRRRHWRCGTCQLCTIPTALRWTVPGTSTSPISTTT